MREIRRKDRILEDKPAGVLLEKGEYGFLAMVNCDGGGYGIPLSYVCSGDSLYFHCAPQGHKLENLRKDNRCSFTVVVATKVIPDKFTTAYESVMVFGTITSELSETERLEALRLLVAKYSPGYEAAAEKYIGGSFHRTGVMRFDMTGRSAKAKRIG